MPSWPRVYSEPEKKGAWACGPEVLLSHQKFMKGHHGGCAWSHGQVAAVVRATTAVATSSAPWVSPVCFPLCQNFQTMHGLAFSEHAHLGVTDFPRHWDHRRLPRGRALGYRAPLDFCLWRLSGQRHWGRSEHLLCEGLISVWFPHHLPLWVAQDRDT